MRVDFNILMLVLDIEREIAVEGEIGLFNLIAGEPLCLTSIGIDEGRD